MGIHIHLVHHLKKPPKESDMPDKHDTKGSGSITDQADNLFVMEAMRVSINKVKT